MTMTLGTPYEVNSTSRLGLFSPTARRRLMRAAGGGEQRDQFLQLFSRQMPELPHMALHQRLAQLAQQPQPRLGNANADDAAVVGRPLAADQAALVELVEHAGDVRGP